METSAPTRDFLTIAQVAELLDVSAATIRRKIEAGQIPACQLRGEGTSIRVPRAALDAWLWSEADAAR